jgi:hypothetical protein
VFSSGIPLIEYSKLNREDAATSLSFAGQSLRTSGIALT